MKQVYHTTQLSGKYLTGFSGKNYADSVSIAEEYAKRNEWELVSYFEQEFKHKAILVGYDKENENE